MAAAKHFHLFDTPIGVCALIWRDDTLIGAQLPERDEAAARARIARRFPDATEGEAMGFMADAVAEIRQLLAGEPRDLSHLPIDLSAVSSFNRRVYEVALAIPPGETMTYGDVAKRLGDPGASRAVGVALGQNPWPIVVPCHRVLASGGRTGGFSAEGGVETKLRMLTIEKARTSIEPSLFGALPLAARPR